MPKKVLIAIDWSDSAEKAFDWYVYHIHKKGTKVVLTHYIEADKEKELRKKEEELLELQEVYENRLLQMKIDHEWITKTGITGSGSSPWDHIIQTCHSHQCELIVMGTRGLGKIKKAFLGSVSDNVISKAKVPVLVYR